MTSSPSDTDGLDDPYRPLPVDVPGYEEAMAANLLPVVSKTAPVMLPGASSRRLLIRTIVGIFVTLLVLIPSLNQARSHGASFIMVLLPSLGVVAVFILMLRAVWRRQLAELHFGYTLFSGPQFGTLATIRPWRRAMGNLENPFAGVPWNNSGVWTLSDNGSVITAPDFNVTAPGYYPSPHRPGQMELWTGQAWARAFRK